MVKKRYPQCARCPTKVCENRGQQASAPAPSLEKAPAFCPMKISADIFPDLEDARRSKFQNWPEWAQNGWIDFLYPMAYSTDVAAVRKHVAGMREIVPAAFPIFVGLAPYLGLSGGALIDQIEAAEQEGADGVVLFSLGQISDDMMRLLSLGPFRTPAIVPEK